MRYFRFLPFVSLAIFLIGLLAVAHGQVGQITRPAQLVNPTPGAYTAQGVNYVSPGYGALASALTGASDSGSGIASIWVNNTNATGSQRSIFAINSGTTVRFQFGISGASGKLFLQGFNSSGTQTLAIQTTTVLTSMSTTWKNVLFSWNLATPTALCYTSDVADGTPTIDTASGTINYSATLVNIAVDNPTGAHYYATNMADMQVWLGSFLDLTVTANRRLFIDGSGNAVNPTTASATLGTPIVLQTGTVASWSTNKGSGGGFSATTSAPTAASSNPP